MKKNTFLLLFIFILLFALILKIVPSLGNNFYFTMDQGNDATDIREIVTRHQLLLRGPGTGIEGLYTGPLWYYFISFGYAIFKGHPFGGVFMVILLNVLLTALIMHKVAKHNALYALILGLTLQSFWPFYDTSRYAFNPFPIVFLSIATIFSLIDTLEGRKNALYWGAVFVGLSFHCEVAAAIPFFVFYILFNVFLLIQRKIFVKKSLVGLLIIGLFFIPHLVSELTTNFSQLQSLQNQISLSNRFVSGTNFNIVAFEFQKLVGITALPQKSLIGVFIFLAITAFFFAKKKADNFYKFSRQFFLLSLTLVCIFFVWFSSNKGWQTWHTVSIPVFLFISLFLMILSLPKKIGYPLLAIILFFQIINFGNLYAQYFRPSDDPSLLANELKAVDWVYQESGNEGFSVYHYLPSVLDYPYQYLFWWRGSQKYGYLPCEFASYPKAPKLFLLGSHYYEEPKRSCSNLRFLIVEPDKHIEIRQNWLDNLRANTKLLNTTNFGKILVEKREVIE